MYILRIFVKCICYKEDEIVSVTCQILFCRNRNVIVGAALFRKAGLTAGRRRLSLAGEDIIGLADRTANCGSRTSIDSADSVSHKFVGEFLITQVN